MGISLIVAMAENRVIGADGAMPWQLSSDLKMFKALTMGKPIVMGGKTFRAIGRPLPGRPNIVITRSRGDLPEGVHGAVSLENALAMAQHLAKMRGVDEIMVIGGGEIYAQALAKADRIYLTRVHLSVEGDTYFPEIDPKVWREIKREDHKAGPKDSADFTFSILERENPG